MNGILTIAKKDLRALFFGPLFYLIGGFCTTIWSLIFFSNVSTFVRSSPYSFSPNAGEDGMKVDLHNYIFKQHIGIGNFILILAIAALTMRLFTEEKKQKTMDLLLTSPVTATQIVLGKFIAGLTAAWGLVGLSAIYPLSLRFFTEYDMGLLLTAYMGFMLMTMCYVAVGIFSSSLTESPVLSVLMSLIFSVSLLLIPSIGESFEDPFWSKVFRQMSAGNHFVEYIMGTISVTSLVYFLTVGFLFFFLTQRIIESARWR